MPPSTNETCTPCMLRQARKNTVSATPLALQAALSENDAFNRLWRLNPLSTNDWHALREGRLGTKGINQTIASPGLKRASVPFYFKGDAGNVRVWTDMFKGLGVVYKVLPGAETPVCDGTDVESILNEETLKELKANGVDVIVIVTFDSPDTAWHWGRRKVAEKNLEFLMPNSLAVDNLNSKIPLHPTMPVIIMLANPGLEIGNELGLVMPDGAPRLGMTYQRANVFWGRDNRLLKIVKAEDTSLEKCGPVLGPQLLEDVKGLPMKPRETQRPALTPK